MILNQLPSNPAVRDGALHRGVAAWADWYMRMGVLDAIEPPGWRQSPAEPTALASPPPDIAAERPASRPKPAPRLPGLHEPSHVASARAVAQACGSLEALEAGLRDFDGCPLAATATNLCFADGNRQAPLMLIGEAPGAEEDRQGRPFSGPSGRLLDRMLATVGLSREHAYLTNVIYWRPPGNRSPTQGEIAICLPFLERQIELLQPRLMVSVGGVAARVLLDVKEGVTALRGRKFLYEPAWGGPPIPTLVTFNPAYLLRQPLQKRFAWRDLLQLRAELRALGIDNDPAGSGRAGSSDGTKH